MIRFFLVVFLIRLLLSTEKPLLCAGIYGGVSFVLSVWRHPPATAAVLAAFGFGGAFVYFWLLDKLEGSGFFWLIMPVDPLCAWIAPA